MAATDEIPTAASLPYDAGMTNRSRAPGSEHPAGRQSACHYQFAGFDGRAVDGLRQPFDLVGNNGEPTSHVAGAGGFAYKPLLDKLGITYPQFLVLHALWEQDGRTIGSIAERLALEPSSITPLSKRLAAAGFVRRERDPENERQVRVVLTDKGQSFREEGAYVAAKILGQTGLTLSTMRDLSAQIQQVRQTLISGIDHIAAKA